MSSNDPYANVLQGKLKLKKDDGIKKKKKSKSKKIPVEQIQNVLENADKKTELSSKQKRTKAELAFIKQKEKNVSICVVR